MKEKRGSFSGGIGFVLAAAGSAVGLGNLWRFPYLAARHGGGIFILVYIALVLTFGFSLLLLEIAIGRKTKKSSIVAYKELNKKFGFLGYLAALVPVIILPYYCVIGGWVTKYMTIYVTGNGTAAAEGTYFGEFISGTASPIIFFLIFLVVTLAVVIGGVQNGIERVSKVLMPVLLLITIGIGIYICTLENAWEGIKYYLLPDFSNLSVGTVCAAIGQLFFSMSIAMGIMVSYGSYVKDDVNATPVSAYIMCECIAKFREATGKIVGFKPAGGISTAQDALCYYSIVSTILGKEWLNKNLFRFGVSRVANSILSAVEQKTVSFF